MRILIVIACLIAVVYGQSTVCTEAQAQDLDTCGQNLFMLGDRMKTSLPINDEQLMPYCTSLKQSHRCISNYSDVCLDGMAKQVVGLLLKGATKVINLQCETDASKAEFLSHTACFNKDFPALHTCMENYIDKLQGLSKATKEDKIPLTCCNFYAFRDCIAKNLEAQPACTDADRKYMFDMLNGFASEVLDLLCGHTPPQSDLCNVLISPTKDAGLARCKSILPPFITTFSNF
jgi:hypothetical protein